MNPATTNEAGRRTFWPYGLAIAIGLFMVTLISVVVYLSMQRVDLVTEDYYAQELVYQEQIERLKRTAASGHAELRLDATGRWLRVTLPAEHRGQPVTGNLLLYRPSDARLDRRVALAMAPGGYQDVEVSGCQAGRWIAKLAWTCAGQEFYQETDITMGGSR